jgi:hypothetical protein
MRLAFAGPMKEAMALMGARKGGPRDKLYRAGCQLVGNKFRDSTFVPGITGQDYWVRIMEERLEVCKQAEDNRLTIDDGAVWRETLVLIDDVRFLNEIEVIRKWGGKVVFIDAFRRMKDDMDAAWRNHPSEMMALDYTQGRGQDELMDCTITNNSSIEDFQRVLGTMAPSWGGLRVGDV